MIRFSAALVVVAVGVLIGGIATSLLALVYVAIALSAAALIALAIGVALKRDELFGVTGQPVRDVMGAAAGQPAIRNNGGSTQAPAPTASQYAIPEHAGGFRPGER